MTTVDRAPAGSATRGSAADGPSRSGRSMLLTFLGELVLTRGGSFWTSTAIEALTLLDIDERNTRQALIRLADTGIVSSHRHGRRTRWSLTERGQHVLTSGAKRIYEFGHDDDDWDGHWVVVSCPVPEDERHKRYELRARLGFAGFGFVGMSLALSPHPDREAVATAILRELGLVAGAVVLRAEAGEATPDRDLIDRAWDLASLAERYTAFLERFEDVRPTDPPSAVRELVELVHAWRWFPVIDPEIPRRLLPDRWPGQRSTACFASKRAAWSPLATDWFHAAES